MVLLKPQTQSFHAKLAIATVCHNGFNLNLLMKTLNTEILYEERV